MLAALTYPFEKMTTPKARAMKAMNGIAPSIQPFDRTSDKIRRGETTKRGTRWRGKRAKSIGTDKSDIHQLGERGVPERTPRRNVD